MHRAFLRPGPRLKFGMIHKPRTRSEKLKHLEVLNSVPLEMVPAFDERNNQRTGRISKRTDPISNILLRYEASPETELIKSMCRACALGETDSTLWGIFVTRISDLERSLTSIDAGIILKCLLLHEAKTLSKEYRGLMISVLRKVCEGASLGSYTVVFALQALNHLADELPPKVNARYFYAVIRQLKYTSTDFTALLACLQAISVRTPVVAPTIVAPLISELSDRCVAKATKMDTDALFGLISAVARLSPSKEKSAIMNVCKGMLINPDDDSEEFLLAMSIEQLAGVAHAYSRLGPAVTANNIDIFTELGNQLRRCDEWTPRTVSVVINAFGASCVAHSDLLHSLKSIRSSIISEMDSMQISMSVYGLSKLGVLGDFPQFLQRAENLREDFDIHSTSKMLAAVAGTPYSLKPFMHHFLNLLKKETVVSEAQAESICLVLGSLQILGTDRFATETDLLFQAMAKRVDVCNLRSVSLILTNYSSLRSETFLRLNSHLLKRLLHADVGSSLDLLDFSRYMYVFGLTLKPSLTDAEKLREIVISKLDQLETLGYRSLTRLASSLARCGIYDEDLMSAINQRLAKFTISIDKP
jgi:hypothetical protein